MSSSYPDGVTPDEAEALRAVAKEALRKRLAALRRTLSSDTRAAYAHALSERVVAEEAFARARVVLAYSALRFEVDPYAVVERAWALGKTVALPRIIAGSRELALHVYRSGDELCESGFVVKEPLASAPQVSPEEVELVLVPGLGFDARGQRLGFGQGYYDRLLPRLSRAARFGLAFELSLLAEVPTSTHDVPVDAVVTEKRVLRAAALPASPRR